MKNLILLVLFLSATKATACFNSYNCSYGQVCVKGQYQSQGVCMIPTDRYGNQGVPRGYGAAEVKFCSYDNQCGYQFYCKKQNHFASQGVCVKR